MNKRIALSVRSDSRAFLCTVVEPQHGDIYTVKQIAFVGYIDHLWIHLQWVTKIHLITTLPTNTCEGFYQHPHKPIYNHSVSAAASSGEQSFRRRQQELPKRQQQTNR